MSGKVTGANGGIAGERGAAVSGAERVGDEVREGALTTKVRMVQLVASRE
jgi:hypothetical protein